MLIISAVVSLLIHFPEVLSLSDSFEQHALFPGMQIGDVVNEIVFTFISLLILFWINTRIFHFDNPMARMTALKIVLSFLLVWIISNLLGQIFVLLHHNFNIPAIDAMVHHYLHPLRDFIMSCIVVGSCYIIHLILKQQKFMVENQQLRTESILNQYEVLKSQLNPHMLFNSLNTLQALIRDEPSKALSYTHELSCVLRYTLQSNDSKHVTLEEEMKFVKAYIFMMKMRYEENLSFNIEINEHFNLYVLPPMSIQILIENAIKHNEISNRRPLTLSIQTKEDGTLVVRNSIQAKLTTSKGPGIGLDNLAKRYRLLFHLDIQISVENDTFCVQLPLIKSDER